MLNVRGLDINDDDDEARGLELSVDGHRKSKANKKKGCGC
jgi:hypothetical protein